MKAATNRDEGEAGTPAADGNITSNTTTMDNHPKIINLDKERMKSLEDLTRIGMQVSERHIELEAVKGLEADYLVEREGRAIAAVDRVLNESEEILATTAKNYGAVQTLAEDTRVFSDRLMDLFAGVKSVLERFNTKAELWEKNVADREARLAEQKTVVKMQEQAIANSRKSLDARTAEVLAAEEKLKADQAEITKMFALKEVN